jgi:hypothetical protein
VAVLGYRHAGAANNEYGKHRQTGNHLFYCHSSILCHDLSVLIEIPITYPIQGVQRTGKNSRAVDVFCVLWRLPGTARPAQKAALICTKWCHNLILLPFIPEFVLYAASGRRIEP